MSEALNTSNEPASSRRRSGDEDEEDDGNGDTDTAKKKKEQKKYVSEPGPMDVLLGRGKRHLKQKGNALYQNAIELNSTRYNKAKTRYELACIQQEIVEYVGDQGGHFLDWDKKAKSWVEITDVAAREKVSMSFRNLRKKDAASNARRNARAAQKEFAHLSAAGGTGTATTTNSTQAAAAAAALAGDKASAHPPHVAAAAAAVRTAMDGVLPTRGTTTMSATASQEEAVRHEQHHEATRQDQANNEGAETIPWRKKLVARVVYLYQKSRGLLPSEGQHDETAAGPGKEGSSSGSGSSDDEDGDDAADDDEDTEDDSLLHTGGPAVAR